MPKSQLIDLQMEVVPDYFDGELQGFNIVNKETNEEIVGSEGIYAHQGEELAQLMAKSPQLLEAVKYLRRFVKTEDVDTDFVDNVIKDATTIESFPFHE